MEVDQNSLTLTDEQFLRISKSLEIFKKENIEIRSFFAPNHTYDEILFSIKNNNIKNIIDGYGLMPFNIHNMNFIPNYFIKKYFYLRIQSTQVHLNY